MRNRCGEGLGTQPPRSRAVRVCQALLCCLLTGAPSGTRTPLASNSQQLLQMQIKEAKVCSQSVLRALPVADASPVSSPHGTDLSFMGGRGVLARICLSWPPAPGP